MKNEEEQYNTFCVHQTSNPNSNPNPTSNKTSSLKF